MKQKKLEGKTPQQIFLKETKNRKPNTNLNKISKIENRFEIETQENIEKQKPTFHSNQKIPMGW